MVCYALPARHKPERHYLHVDAVDHINRCVKRRGLACHAQLNGSGSQAWHGRHCVVVGIRCSSSGMQLPLHVAVALVNCFTSWPLLTRPLLTGPLLTKGWQWGHGSEVPHVVCAWVYRWARGVHGCAASGVRVPTSMLAELITTRDSSHVRHSLTARRQRTTTPA
jgi:hypothetical protein